MVEYAFDFTGERVVDEWSDPFLRWAGGKRRLLHHMLPLVPLRAQHYVEPFLGGGALFFRLAPKGNLSIISDCNEELINCYRLIQSKPEEIISSLGKMKYSKRDYYQARSATPADDTGRAVRFLYLNRTCWNGLYRVNSDGVFNVPMGRFTAKPVVCDPEGIRAASKRLAGVEILHADFEVVAKRASDGDFVYLDPPYITKKGNNGFIEYNKHLFAWKDQERLAKVARLLRDQGAYVMISNSSSKYVQDLYEGFSIHIVNRASIISGTESGRGRVKEVLITSYQVPDEIGSSQEGSIR